MLSSQSKVIEEQAIELTSSSIKMYNESFNFDWNDYRTIESNKTKVTELELFLEKILPFLNTLEESDRYAFGQLCFKLGSFYNHIKRAPAPALEKLLIAEGIVTGNEFAWAKNHIAFSFQQKLAASKRENNPEKVKDNAALALEYCNKIIKQYASPEDVEGVKITAFAYCVKALAEYEGGQLNAAVHSYRFALDLYEKHGMLDDQYARAKNRYAQFLVDQKNYSAANNAFEELENYWSSKQDKFNPYPARFYVSYADYLAKNSPDQLTVILDKYKKAYDILCVTDGEHAQFTDDIGKKVSDLQEKLNKQALNVALDSTVRQLMVLPFEAREKFIESFSTLLLRGFVPMSGMTVQQHIFADPLQLEQLNKLTNKKEAYKNGTDARYVYQFAREATSGGIIPAYRDKTTGDIYVALICNKRNLEMYNLSAGYTEAPLPGWRDKLQSETEQEIYYNRAKIKESATHSMEKALEVANGDWTKVDYDYKQFEKGFKSDGVLLPKTDINSLHTATRECIEEIDLDLNQFPQRKTFLISYDNTVGISQGDAPRQTSNRSHQYMVYLGEFDEQPAIKPGDDVAIADWVKVSDIQRKNAMDYVVNEKPLCIYMLRSIEWGLKDLWHFLLQQTSTKDSRYSGKSLTRFSSPENVVAEIEIFCDKHGINLEGTRIARFLKNISGDLPSQTYTGKPAQSILNCLLGTAAYLMRQNLNPETFIEDMTELLAPLDAPSKLYLNSANLFHFKPVSEQKSVVSKDSSLQQTPRFGTAYTLEENLDIGVSLNTCNWHRPTQ